MSTYLVAFYDFILGYKTKKCFQIFSQVLAYTDADNLCQTFNGKIISWTKNADENTFIESKFTEKYLFRLFEIFIYLTPMNLLRSGLKKFIQKILIIMIIVMVGHVNLFQN